MFNDRHCKVFLSPRYFAFYEQVVVHYVGFARKLGVRENRACIEGQDAIASGEMHQDE